MTAPGPVSDLVCIGAVSGARGLKGEVRIKTFTASPQAIADYGDVWDEAGQKSYGIRLTGTVSSKGKGDGLVLARLSGVDDRDTADALKGTRLYVPKTSLPAPDEDEYYYADLIGLKVELEDGSELGVVTAVNDFGAGPVIEFAGGEAGTVLAPFTKAVVPVVDIKGGRVVIAPPDGLLDEPDENELKEQSGDGE